jgi:hypothetical protein
MPESSDWASIFNTLKKDRKLKAKFLLLLLACFLLMLTSCVKITHPKLALTNNINPGISKSEFVEIFGEPISSRYKKNYYLLQYFLERNDGFPVTYYFVFDNNKKSMVM